MEKEELYKKISRYCAYQERCRSEVITKMRQIGADNRQCTEMLAIMEQEGFVDDERFARAYVRGKLRINGWGRLKIRNGLRAKLIDSKLIETVLKEEVNEEAYRELLNKTLSAKGPQTALSRGFEPNLIKKDFQNQAE